MQTLRPRILIAGSLDRRGTEFSDSSLSLSQRYPLAIQAAGGLPLAIPCLLDAGFIAESVRGCDGVLLTGGDDVQPELFGQTPDLNLKNRVQLAGLERDLFDLMLIDEVFRQRKPLLAICRGQQILNVALGGTLYLDIASQVPGALQHKRMDRKNQVVHEVEIQVGSLLAQCTRLRRLWVNSTHHQSVAQIAKPLRAIAVSKDGIIEGVELKRAARQFLPYLLAVQFHPERLWARHPEHLELFKSFVRAALSNRS